LQDTLIRKSEAIGDLEARLGAAADEQMVTSAALRDALCKLQVMRAWRPNFATPASMP
jgi:hypothetical protein